jgi:Polyketide cyclase / dehydrase and lipid transport
MISVTRRDSGPLQAGSTAQVQQPKLRPALWTVESFEPNRNFTWSTQSLGIHMQAGHLVEAEATGCRVTLSFDVDGWLAFMVKSMYGKLIDEYVATEAAGLKRYCEQSR